MLTDAMGTEHKEHLYGHYTLMGRIKGLSSFGESCSSQVQVIDRIKHSDFQPIFHRAVSRIGRRSLIKRIGGFEIIRQTSGPNSIIKQEFSIIRLRAEIGIDGLSPPFPKAFENPDYLCKVFHGRATLLSYF